MPGHFKAAIDNYPFLSCNEESGWDTVFTYPTCLGKETTYDFMKNILSEVVELFPAEYVHIGGDEVNIKSWKKCPHCQKAIKENSLKDEHELQSHFNRDIEQFLQSKGKKFMGWDEIVAGGLTKSANVMWWRNWFPNSPKIAAKNGNGVVVTTTAAYYFDYLNEGTTLERVYNYEPIPEDFTIEETNNVLGIQANLWSEWIPSFKRLQYQAFPRMLAVSENAWAGKKKDFKSFNARVEGHYKRLDVLDVYYYIPAVEGLKKEIAMVDQTEVTLELAYPLDGVEIFYSLDGSIPTKDAIKYKAPFTVTDTVTIKARAYLGDKFNDIKTNKVVRKKYVETSSDQPTEKGLKRWVLKGKFKEVDDVTVPSTTDFTKVDSIYLGKEFKGEKKFSFAYLGYFKAEKDGVYEFETRSDGGDKLFIGDQIVVDNSGWHGPRKRYGKIALKVGWHPITIKYRPSDKPRVINAWYGLQGEELQPITSEVTSY